MPSTKGGSLNGGLLGAKATSSHGKGKVTTKTATGTIDTLSGTTLVDYLVIAGGGSGGLAAGAGGGGAGGYRNSVAGETSGGGASNETSVSITAGATLTATVGGGGAALTGPGYCAPGNQGNPSSLAGCGMTTITSIGS